MCPLPRAMPLKNDEGTTYFAVMMGVRGSESLVARQPIFKADQAPRQEDMTAGETSLSVDNW